MAAVFKASGVAGASCAGDAVKRQSAYAEHRTKARGIRRVEEDLRSMVPLSMTYPTKTSRKIGNLSCGWPEARCRSCADIPRFARSDRSYARGRPNLS